jgi:lysophospholipase L1-like esterase
MNRAWKIRAYGVIATLVLVLLVIIVVSVFLPGQVVINTTQDGGTIYFAADRRIVFAPGDCVHVTWRVEGVREVYVNGEPIVGEGMRRICVDRDQLPTLEIIFQQGDGVRQSFTLPVLFFIDQPVALALIAAIILSLIAMVFVLLAPQPVLVSTTTGAVAIAPRRTTGRVERFLSFVGGALVLLLLTAGVLELLLRFYFGTFGGASERIRYLYTAAEIDALNPNLIPLPLVQYGLSPLAEGHNRLGWRGNEISLPKPTGVFRIVALGASTTYGFTTVDESYPAWLERILRDTYNYGQVEVINAGISGYTSFHQVVSLAFRVLELEPDLIIYYEGNNDILTREMPPECYRGINPLRGTDPRSRVASAETPPLSPFVLYRILSISLGWERDPLSLESLFRPYTIDCGGAVISEYLETSADLREVRAPQNLPVYYERNLRTIVGIARIHDIQMMVVTWAYNESSPEAYPFWQTVIAEHNAIITRLAEEYNLLYVDYAPLAPQDDENWSDYIHMNGIGSRHQAEALAAYLDEVGIIPRPN